MSKRKTAMQKLKEILLRQADNYDSEYMNLPLKAEALRDATNAIDMLLPTERENIEQAFKDGGENEYWFVSNASEYYDKTYGE